MESRVEDNSSPEPTTTQQECYKTPSLPQHTHYYNFYQTQYPFTPYANMTTNGYPFPTPPSSTDSPSSVNSSLLSNGSFIGHYHSTLPTYTVETPKNTSYYESKPAYSYQTSPESQDESSQHQTESNEEKENEDEEKNQKGSARCKRRSRTCYSRNQLEELELLFQKTNYPEIRLVEELASRLKLDYDRISIWFQNRRARDKKQKKKQASPYSSYYNPQTNSASSPQPNSQLYAKNEEKASEEPESSISKQTGYINSTRPYATTGFNSNLNFPFYQPYYNNCYYQNGDYNSVKAYSESASTYQQL